MSGQWRFICHLSCGHEVDFGIVSTQDCERLTPRRKDGKFAALRCPERCGRRRVTFTHSTNNLTWRPA